MQFFMPQAKPREAEEVYQEIKDTLFSQFRLPIQDRRIFRLSYTNSKKKWRAEVGQSEQQERRYQIMAIFESKQFIVFTRTAQGHAGPVILVDKAEVTDAEDFEL
jgi:hypothetical protein